MAKLIQITPNFPPLICGVGDYAAQIASALGELGIPVATIVANEISSVKRGQSLHGTRSSGALQEALRTADTGSVIVHFSGYGYAPYGLCDWLVEGLRQWKGSRSDGRIVTLFHEVYATGPIWRRSFWTSRPQRRIARDLARITDRCFVSSTMGAAQLHKIGVPESCEVLPVFSNVGEPAEVAPLSDRSPQAVVFGGRGQRRLVYEALKQRPRQTERLLSELKIDRILDIGPDLPQPDVIANRPVKALGVLPAGQVSEFLLVSRLGLLDYPENRLTKSGILAAYLAHGIFAFNLRGTSALVGGADVPPHGDGFACLESIASDGQAIAAAGHAWYQKHGIAAVARRLSDAVETSSLRTVSSDIFPRDDT